MIDREREAKAILQNSLRCIVNAIQVQPIQILCRWNDNVNIGIKEPLLQKKYSMP